MTMWGSICRICGSPAEYEIFDKIPNYLHATTTEFTHWQKPIYVMLEETTGLKVSKNDDLPHNICDLCISYLKHAATFREQAIRNTLSLEVARALYQKSKGKGENNETHFRLPERLDLSEERNRHSNLLLHSTLADYNKVRKRLLNNNFITHMPIQQRIEHDLRYLNILFNKNSSSGARFKERMPACYNNDDIPTSSGDNFLLDDFQTPTSSEDNEGAAQGNIFTYSEKNFEEDDIMDIDELRNSIRVNIPDNCKERKCRACFRRYMFDDTYRDHLRSCIELRLLLLIEESNRLLEVRRIRTISPHEFIRRMIFCLRKTCDWLKVNCYDTFLPELLDRHVFRDWTAADSDDKSSTTEFFEQKFKRESKKLSSLNTNKKLMKLCQSIDFSTDSDEYTTNSNSITNDDKNEMNPLKSRPINTSNNILYEIERSLSQNSSESNDFFSMNNSYNNRYNISFNNNNNNNNNSFYNTQLKKPIPILATTSSAAAAAAAAHADQYRMYQHRNQAAAADALNARRKFVIAQGTQTTNHETTNEIKCEKKTNEQLTFLQKLRNIYCQSMPTFKMNTLESDEREKTNTPIPLSPGTAYKLPFSARCHPCGIFFQDVTSLEIHNAMNHNRSTTESQSDENIRKNIIKLFENDSDDDI